MWFLLPLLCGALEIEEIDATLNCSALSCNSATASLGQPCQIVNLETGSTELTPCASPYYCDTTVKNVNVTCDYWPSYKLSSFPGEPCNTDSQCQYGYCGDGNICVGKSYNQTCSVNGECNPGFYCGGDYSTCLNQLAPGSRTSCKHDYECSNLSGCYNGRCTLYGTLQNQALINCPKASHNPLCSSGYCANGSCEGNITSAELPQTCNADIACHSKEGSVAGTCECGYNSDATAYCTLFPEDPDFREMNTMLKKWYNSTLITNCNTSRRFANQCIAFNWVDYVDQPKYFYYTSRVQNWAKIQNNTACIKDTYNKDYWTLENNWQAILDNDEIIEGEEWAAAVAAAILILVI